MLFDGYLTVNVAHALIEQKGAIFSLPNLNRFSFHDWIYARALLMLDTLNSAYISLAKCSLLSKPKCNIKNGLSILYKSVNLEYN